MNKSTNIIKIAFIWQGISDRVSVWNDGLALAMRHLEKEYEVTYHEPTDEIPEDAVILYWEAPCTINGGNAYNYLRVRSLPNKKILLFAGGPLKKEWVQGFNMLCVESKINADECEAQGIPYLIAFGINEEIMKPMKYPKQWDGIHHGTCASWKRQWLVGEALGGKGLVVGRDQDTDPMPFKICKELGTLVLPEQGAEQIAQLINQSETCVQTSDYWGGGQRCTLEAMACGVPVVCMEDSPKNREYVEESGFGAVCYPNKEEIRKTVEDLKERKLDPKVGRKYIMSKWTSKHYANNLKKAILKVI